MHKRNVLAATLAFGLVVAHGPGAAWSATPAASPGASVAETETIAQEAYIYFYPLVLMDVSRKHFTNIEADKMFARGPMNTFAHARTFPPATFRGATHAKEALQAAPAAGQKALIAEWPKVGR